MRSVLGFCPGFQKESQELIHGSPSPPAPRCPLTCAVGQPMQVNDYTQWVRSLNIEFSRRTPQLDRVASDQEVREKLIENFMYRALAAAQGVRP